VIALPPSAGGTNDTVTCAFPAVSVGCVGALGIVLGMTAADAGDAAPAPLAFAAVTVHVYDFPFVNAPTTVGELRASGHVARSVRAEAGSRAGAGARGAARAAP